MTRAWRDIVKNTVSFQACYSLSNQMKPGDTALAAARAAPAFPTAPGWVTRSADHQVKSRGHLLFRPEVPGSLLRIYSCLRNPCPRHFPIGKKSKNSQN